MSYYTESLKTISEKVTLVTMESAERVKLFTTNGAVYERVTDYFVVGVKDAGTVLTENTLPLSNNQWNYSPTTKLLTIKVTGDPKTHDISLTYRHFFSTAPINAPYDLSTGETVEWEPYLSSIGSVGQQLDEENTGIVLESQSSITLINTDGYFDGKFDKLIWENQDVAFYSWFPTTSITDKIKLFEGVIESKSFDDKAVSFKVKDFVYKLKNFVNLGQFSSSDGDILPSLIGTPKRRIYGKADYVKCVCLDATLGGFTLTGTCSGSLGGTTITGSGTSFNSEVSPGDELFFTQNETVYRIGVEAVNSDTSITASSALVISLVFESLSNKPTTPYRLLGREWHVAGHKLRESPVTISQVKSSNTFTVSSVAEYEADDEIFVNGIKTSIRRISGSDIVTKTNIVPIPVVSNTISKAPIRDVFIGSTKLLYSRDYTYTNSTYSKVSLTPLAEFYATEQREFNFNLTFTSGSRSVTTSATVDLKSFLKPRDWIRSTNTAKTQWYEILEVKEQEILLRATFGYGTETGGGYYKIVDVVDENSLVTVNAFGMDYSNTWMRTASDAVRHLILNDAEFTTVNETSFIKAKADCDYTLSMVIPDKVGAKTPLVRDIITKINESIFGSLYGDSAQNISYSVFNSVKPESLTSIGDDDIIDFSVATTQKIVNSVKINYRPYVDIYSKGDAVKTLTHASTFVDNLVGIKNTIEKTVYLYDDSDAEIYAQRLSFFKSLSSSVIRLRGKLNFAQLVVNDKLYLSLDRLFKRYAGTESKRIGVVSGIKKDGFGCEITVSDLGNIYNRVMSIAPNTTLDYLNSTSDDIMRWGYIVDDDTETPNVSSETGLGSNLIG